MCFLGFITFMISQREQLVTDTSSYFRARCRPIFRNYVQILSLSQVGMQLPACDALFQRQDNIRRVISLTAISRLCVSLSRRYSFRLT